MNILITLEIEEVKEAMIVQFMQRSKPTTKQIWKGTGKQSITITRITMSRQPYELPIWTVEYEEVRPKSC